ncbi:MAG: hypothetical protein ACKVS8_11555 [Phycisphaerales bacterium]
MVAKVPAEGQKPIPPEWIADFEAAAKRTLEQRFKYAFIKTYKPVLDDAKYRSFESMAEYRDWCEKNLPEWLGYGRAGPETGARPATGVPAAKEPGLAPGPQ